MITWIASFPRPGSTEPSHNPTPARPGSIRSSRISPTKNNELAGVHTLVTGGAGFIGSHLVDALLERGADVTVLDDLSTGHRSNLSHHEDRISVVIGDIRDMETCREATRDCQLVFHLAARGSVPRSIEEPSPTIAVNVLGTMNVFSAAREARARRVVYSSSSSVYGDSPALPKREGEEGDPLSPYAASKQMNEEIATVCSSCYGQDSIGLRYFNIYGPRQDPEGPYAAVIPKLFSCYLRGDAPTIFGDGEQSRDFTYVGDAVRANLLAATAPPPEVSTALNVATGNTISVNRLADHVRTLCGGGPDPKHVAERPGDVRHSAADVSLAERLIAYEPTVELEEGLALTHEYFAAHDSGSDAG